MTSTKKAIQIIDKQIKKLDLEPFDLEAWKSGTQSILAMLFGSSHASIAQIRALKVDYSSWALRDATAKYNPVATCKLMGKEVLESAKDQIELFGLEKSNQEEAKQADISPLSTLSAAEKKKLDKAMAHDTPEKKLLEIEKIVCKWKPERQVQILAELLVSQSSVIS